MLAAALMNALTQPLNATDILDEEKVLLEIAPL
jgi:hypothetical protein